MPTYVSLLDFTDQGTRTIRDTLKRAQRAAELAQKHGARLEQLYWTVGLYDLVGVVKVPDDESATAFLLEASSGGAIRTTTLRVFDREEISRIIERLRPS